MATAETTNRVPGGQRTEFWRYSSRNREGHRRHPQTAVRREAILIHWSAGWTEDAIAQRLGIDVDTVGRHLREARKGGDTRAAIRHAATLQARESAT
jgi:DNA-binding NarL/FixJ family response regulator